MECSSVLVSNSMLLPIPQEERGARGGFSKEDHIKDPRDRKKGLKLNLLI